MLSRRIISCSNFSKCMKRNVKLSSQCIKKCEKDKPKVLIIVFYFLHEGAHVKIDVNNDLIPALENSTLKEFAMISLISDLSMLASGTLFFLK